MTTTDIAADLADDFSTDATVIGTSAAQVVPVGIKIYKGVQLKAAAGNANVIYVGKEGSVTAANGFPLAAGEGLFIPIKDVTKIWAISGAISQSVSWFAV